MGNAVVINADLARFLKTGQGIETLVIGAAEVSAEIMIKNISKKTGSGKAYKTNTGLGYHIASSPGEFPVVDSGSLLDAIRVFRGRGTTSTADIVIESSYALDLEFGTSKMRSRPFIIRSVDEAFRTRFQDIIDKFIDAIENDPHLIKSFLNEYFNRYIRKPSRSAKSKANWRRRRGLSI